MKKYINGQYIELTPEEIAQMQAEQAEAERSYWLNTRYDDLVDSEIRKRYTASQEFAILRQKDEKPEEYAEYYAYCEECKAYVKEKKGLIAEDMQKSDEAIMAQYPREETKITKEETT